jgi:hypothetical protein
MRTIAVVFTALFIVSACGTTGRKTYERAGTRTSVRVENRNKLDMTIYVIHESQRSRLGTVPSFSTRVFNIPNDYVSGATPLRFLADPIGRRQRPISQEITVTPGEQIELLIPN